MTSSNPSPSGPPALRSSASAGQSSWTDGRPRSQSGTSEAPPSLVPTVSWPSRWTVATSRRCCSCQRTRGSVGLATRTPTDREISFSLARSRQHCGPRREGLVSMSDDASRLIGSVVEVVRVEQPDRTMSAVVWGSATHGHDDVPGVAPRSSPRRTLADQPSRGSSCHGRRWRGPPRRDLPPNPAWHRRALGRKPPGNPRRRHARTKMWAPRPGQGPRV